MFIKNCSILDFEKFEINENMDIFVDNGIIAKIEKSFNNFKNKNNKNKNNKKELKSLGSELINGENYYVLPGLTNMHSHTAMTLLRGSAEDASHSDWFNKYIWRYEKNLTPDDVFFGTLLGAIEMLENGVTFVADHYFYMDRAYDAYLQSGIRADLSWALFGVGENSGKNYDNALRFIEEYKNKNRLISVSLGPHSPYICPEEFLKKIKKLSDKSGLKIHIHVSEAKWQVEKSLKEKGVTPIKYLDNIGLIDENTILAHAIYATSEELDIIRKRKALISHAAKTYMRFGDINDSLLKALKNNIKISLATDGVASNGDLSIFEVAKNSALLAKLSRRNPEQGKIKQIFPLMFNGMKNIGILNSGAIKVGNKADMILINKKATGLNPVINIFANILYNISKADIDYVIVDGKVVVKNGNHLFVDKDSLLKEINVIRNRLLKLDGSPMQKYGI